jgi:hypothetical protein
MEPQGQGDMMNAGEQLIALGRAEGEQKGRDIVRAATVTALSARGIPLSEPGRARLAACVDVAVLTQWLATALTAASEAEVFTAGETP